MNAYDAKLGPLVPLAHRVRSAFLDAERLLQDAAHLLRAEGVPTDFEVGEIDLSRARRMFGKRPKINVTELDAPIAGWKMRFQSSDEHSFDAVLAVNGTLWMRQSLNLGILDYPFPQYKSSASASIFESSKDGERAHFWEKIDLSQHANAMIASITSPDQTLVEPGCLAIKTFTRCNAWNLRELGVRRGFIYPSSAFFYSEYRMGSDKMIGTADCLAFSKPYTSSYWWKENSFKSELTRIISYKARHFTYGPYEGPGE